TAIKFHLGYYHVSLVDVHSYRDSNLEKLRSINQNGQFYNELLDTGIKAIFETWPDRANIMAVAPAGWSTSLRKIEHSGFLKIADKVLSDFSDRESLSALFCLHGPVNSY